MYAETDMDVDVDFDRNAWESVAWDSYCRLSPEEKAQYRKKLKQRACDAIGISPNSWEPPNYVLIGWIMEGEDDRTFKKIVFESFCESRSDLFSDRAEHPMGIFAGYGEYDHDDDSCFAANIVGLDSFEGEFLDVKNTKCGTRPIEKIGGPFMRKVRRT